MPIATIPKSAPENAEENAPSCFTSYSFQPETDPLIQSYKKILWIKNKAKMLQAALVEEPIREETEDKTDEELIESIVLSQRDLYEKTNAHDINEISISSLQLADTLYKSLFEEHKGTDETSVNQVETENVQYLKELMIEQKHLSCKVLSEMDEVQKLEDDIFKQEIEISSLATERLIAARENDEKINKRKESELQNDAIKGLKKKLDQKTELVVTLTHILQTLVGHCQLDWAENKDLLELICDIGRPIEEQLDEIVEAQEAA